MKNGGMETENRSLLLPQPSALKQQILSIKANSRICTFTDKQMGIFLNALIQKEKKTFLQSCKNETDLLKDQLIEALFRQKFSNLCVICLSPIGFDFMYQHPDAKKCIHCISNVNLTQGWKPGMLSLAEVYAFTSEAIFVRLDKERVYQTKNGRFFTRPKGIILAQDEENQYLRQKNDFIVEVKNIRNFTLYLKAA